MKPLQPLTTRESQVAELLAWGDIKKEVAAFLKKSIHTIENVARNIFVKLSVSSVNQLGSWYFCKKFNISPNWNPFRRFSIHKSDRS